VALGQIPRHPAAVRVAESVRDDQLGQLPSEHVFAPVPEAGLRSGVELDDPVLGVHHHDRVERGLDRGTQPVLVGLALGDVANDGKCVRFSLIGHRGRVNLDVEPRTVLALYRRLGAERPAFGQLGEHLAKLRPALRPDDRRGIRADELLARISVHREERGVHVDDGTVEPAMITPSIDALKIARYCSSLPRRPPSPGAAR